MTKNTSPDDNRNPSVATDLQTGDEPPYRREFPDFGALDVPLPPGFEDRSVHSEPTPVFVRVLANQSRIRICVDYADQDLRERVGERFRADVTSKDSRCIARIATFEWRKILQFVALHGNAQIIRQQQPEANGSYFCVKSSEVGELDTDEATLLAMLNGSHVDGMPDKDLIIAQMKQQILIDVSTKRIPASIRTFGDLHNYVDANEYGGFCDDEMVERYTAAMPRSANDDPECWPSSWSDFVSDCQNEIHHWILDGGIAPCPCEGNNSIH
jgi:hypothetical protein